MSRVSRVWAAALVVALATVAAACGNGGSGGGGAGGGGSKTLVVDTSFVLKTADPARSFETTGSVIDHVMYDTLLTFEGSDATSPKPWVAKSFEASPDGKTYTFTLRDDVTFSDGTKLTAKDVVYSYNRVKNIKGNPSFLLEGVTPSAPNDTTVVLTCDKPNPALPFVIPNPALGIVNSAAVAKAGGNAVEGADKNDKAEASLNKESMGSGPYQLESYDVQSEVALKANPKYWGTKPAYDRVVIRNTEAAVQKVNVQKGDSQLALDISADQAEGLASDRVKVDETASATLFYLVMNVNRAVSSVTSNADVQEAVRYGVDYAGLVELAGKGSAQAPGVVPQGFLGALDAGAGVKRDLTRAKAALTRSGLSNPTIELSYPSDIQVAGISLGDLATRVQANLKEVGITVKLAPAPVQTALDAFRGAKSQMGLWFWYPDYPDPSDYLVFLPGGNLGLRASWGAGGDPSLSSLGTKAAAEMDNDARAKTYQEIQQALNTKSPFVPLVQPSQVFAYSSSLKGVAYHSSWLIDLADIS